MRTRKAASLLLSLLLVLGLLSGAAGVLADGAAETGTAPEAGAETAPGVSYYITSLEDLLALADACAVDS